MDQILQLTFERRQSEIREIALAAATKDVINNLHCQVSLFDYVENYDESVKLLHCLSCSISLSSK